ncbi:MAG: HAMP domain-containing protein [Rubrivivax sp.]|nr:HAMP domain-containing protein [Rubrivivax sp.]
MKLGRQLLLPPLITAAVALGCGVLYGVLEGRAAAEAEAGVAADIASFKTVGLVQTQLTQVRGDVFRTLTVMASLDDAQVKAARQQLAEQVQAIQQRLQALGGEDGDGAVAEQVAAAMPLLTQYLRQCDRAIDLSTMDPNVGAGGMRSAEDTYGELAKALGAIVARTDALHQARSNEAASQRQALSLGLGLLMLLATGAALAFAWRMQRRVVGAVRQAVDLGEAVSRGELTAQADSTRQDEIGDLTRALGRMVQGLRESLHTVRQATDHIGTASAEIATGNQDLSGRTEQTASNLQQAASSLEQLTGTVGTTADSARTANQLAASAADVAQRGGAVVSQVVSTMDEIHGASRKIADIIAVIDGIAFQTNILALNAAVEAARAGEQGRGFAVVAGEVRSLAQRSAEAAREIKGLIQASVEKVDAGSRLVADAGTTMNEIVASVQRVSDIIGEISAAASEQSSGIAQVNGAVTDLDRMTQQNAALVEQSAAAAESLKDQAQRLAEVVGRFELGGAGCTASAAAASAAPAASPKPAPAVLAASRPAQAAKQALARVSAVAKATTRVVAAATPAAIAASASPKAPDRPPADASGPAPAKAAPAARDDDDWETF